MTGYITLDIMLILMFCTSAGFTLIGIVGPICKRLGIIYEDGVIDFGKSDISLRIRPKYILKDILTPTHMIVQKKQYIIRKRE